MLCVYVYYSVLDFLSFLHVPIQYLIQCYSLQNISQSLPLSLCICGRNIVLTTEYSQGTIQTNRDSEISQPQVGIGYKLSHEVNNKSYKLKFFLLSAHGVELNHVYSVQRTVQKRIKKCYVHITCIVSL